MTRTDARELITATAETLATANMAHWYFGDYSVTITRRRLASGAVRVRIVRKGEVRSTDGFNADRVDVAHRDHTEAEADDLFAVTIALYDSAYRTNRMGLAA